MQNLGLNMGFVRHENQGIAWWSAPQLEALGLRHGVSERMGGISPAPWNSLNVGGSVGDEQARVAANHTRLMQAMGAENLAQHKTHQVHGTILMEAGPANMRGVQPQPEADGLYTDKRGHVLVKHFADCVPVFVYAPKSGLLALVHAGWRGTVADIAGLAAQKLVQLGADAGGLYAAIGPSIGPCCFEVGEDCAAHFEPGVVLRGAGKPHVDLWQANARFLMQAGVKPGHITLAGLCTACHTDAFFSHRAEKGKTGRFAAVAWME
nr:peptidoglycan editing factor PgeF [bacterium]